MLSLQNIFDTIDMIDKQHLDIRTITMGISLLDCVSEDADRCCRKIYDKICRRAEKLVRTGEDIESEFGIPIVNKRISVTPMALVAGSCDTEDYVPFAMTLDRAAHTCGVNFIGGYSALVQKGFSKGDELLLRSIPQALAQTELVCSSVNVGSTKAGINMDAVARMGRIIKETAHLTIDKLEAMTCVCSVGLDMIAVPGSTSAETIAAIIADEAAVGMVNSKTTAVRVIPVEGADVGDMVEMGGLLGSAPVMPVHEASSADFIARGGRIPAPLQSLKN